MARKWIFFYQKTTNQKWYCFASLLEWGMQHWPQSDIPVHKKTIDNLCFVVLFHIMQFLGQNIDHDNIFRRWYQSQSYLFNLAFKIILKNFQVITCNQMIVYESILFFKYNIHGIDNVIMESYLEIVGPF